MTIENKVLVVDDELVLIELFTSILSDFNVSTALNADEGLNIYNESLENNEPFGVILSDMQMPGITDKNKFDVYKISSEREQHIESIKNDNSLEGGIQMAYAIMASVYNHSSNGKSVFVPDIIFMSGATQNKDMIPHLYTFWADIHEESYSHKVIFKGATLNNNIVEKPGQIFELPFIIEEAMKHYEARKELLD